MLRTAVEAKTKMEGKAFYLMSLFNTKKKAILLNCLFYMLRSAKIALQCFFTQVNRIRTNIGTEKRARHVLRTSLLRA